VFRGFRKWIIPEHAFLVATTLIAVHLGMERGQKAVDTAWVISEPTRCDFPVLYKHFGGDADGLWRAEADVVVLVL